MTENVNGTCYRVSRSQIINTIIASSRDWPLMQDAASQTKGIILGPVPDDQAADAYIKAARIRAREDVIDINTAVVGRVVGHALLTGGKVVTITAEDWKGRPATEVMHNFDETFRSLSEADRTVPKL